MLSITANSLSNSQDREYEKVSFRRAIREAVRSDCEKVKRRFKQRLNRITSKSNDTLVIKRLAETWMVEFTPQKDSELYIILSLIYTLCMVAAILSKEFRKTLESSYLKELKDVLLKERGDYENLGKYANQVLYELDECIKNTGPYKDVYRQADNAYERLVDFKRCVHPVISMTSGVDNMSTDLMCNILYGLVIQIDGEVFIFNPHATTRRKIVLIRQDRYNHADVHCTNIYRYGEDVTTVKKEEMDVEDETYEEKIPTVEESEEQFKVCYIPHTPRLNPTNITNMNVHLLEKEEFYL